MVNFAMRWHWGMGMVINLAVVGHRNFYDFGLLEECISDWTDENGHIDLIICGGASGTDYLAERWADNYNVPILIFHEEWINARTGMLDAGRNAAAYTLTQKIIQAATHLIAFPGEDSVWTHRTIELAKDKGILTTVHDITQ